MADDEHRVAVLDHVRGAVADLNAARDLHRLRVDPRDLGAATGGGPEKASARPDVGRVVEECDLAGDLVRLRVDAVDGALLAPDGPHRRLVGRDGHRALGRDAREDVARFRVDAQHLAVRAAGDPDRAEGNRGCELRQKVHLAPADGEGIGALERRRDCLDRARALDGRDLGLVVPAAGGGQEHDDDGGGCCAHTLPTRGPRGSLPRQGGERFVWQREPPRPLEVLGDLSGGRHVGRRMRFDLRDDAPGFLEVSREQRFVGREAEPPVT